MDDTGTSIVSQCAFKGAIDVATALGMNLTVPEHQAAFEELYTFLTDSLFTTIRARLAMTDQQAVSAVVHAFPGTQVVGQSFAPQQAPQQQYVQQPVLAQANFQQQPQQQMYNAPRVKGQSNGAFPDWALQAFAEQGVTEVYDNRHMLAANPKRPWFKSTTGGDNAPAFWPPDR